MDLKTLIKRADAGDPKAQAQLGIDYYDCVARDERHKALLHNGDICDTSSGREQAKKYLYEAALAGEAEAMWRYGKSTGSGSWYTVQHWFIMALKKQCKSAFEVVKKNYEHYDCHFYPTLMAMCYYYGWCVPKNPDKANQIVNKAYREVRESDGMKSFDRVFLGDMCRDSGNVGSAYLYYKQAAFYNPDADFEIGRLHLTGCREVIKDVEKGRKMIFEAAGKRCYRANIFLAKSYSFGENGFEKNEALAFPYCVQTAGFGDPWAEYSAGWFYRTLIKDKDKAYYWYKKAAYQGQQSAVSDLKKYFNA